MGKGTLCKVIRHNKALRSQLGDRVLLLSLEQRSVSLFVGINLRTNSRHHYYACDLEVISESR
mgnify:CR=1 FL=1